MRVTTLALVVMIAAAMSAAPTLAAKGGNSSGPEYSTIELAGSVSALAAPSGSPTFSRGDSVSFWTNVVGLKGTEYPMVVVSCYAADGTKLYAQLDHPDAEFVLGGGSSLWWLIDPAPDATCYSRLYAYGGKVKGYDVIRELTDPADPPLSFATQG